MASMAPPEDGISTILGDQSHLECAPTPQQQTHPSHLIPTSLPAFPQNPLGFLSTPGTTDFEILLELWSPPLPPRHSSGKGWGREPGKGTGT